jgi:hypothetical protein
MEGAMPVGEIFLSGAWAVLGIISVVATAAVPRRATDAGHCSPWSRAAESP